MAGGYIIQVGNEKPAQAIVATPNKKTGNPEGPQMTTYKRVGSHLIINRARVWGRRYMMKEGKKITADIDFNTVGYKGDIEFLEWGADGGYAIDIRYLPQSRSLDFEYQSLVQKIVVNPEQDGAHVVLNAGQNKYDRKKDELLIKFLEVYPQNRDSKSKNPDPAIKGHVFYEVTDEHVDKTSIKRIETSLSASKLVNDLSGKPDQLKNLFKVMGQREEFGDTSLLSGDLQIYRTLLEYSNAFGENFFYLINEYKKGVEDDFRKAESYKALDLTKDGHIALEVNGKKNLIISDLKQKGQAMVDYMVENYYDEEVFKATQIFKELVSKLK